MGKAGEIVDVIEGQAFPRWEQVRCPLCGRCRSSRRIPVAFGMTAMVADCPDCRMAFQTPRPSVEASIAYMDWRWRSSDPYVADAEGQMRRALSQIAYVQQYVDNPGRLIDFGAGAGAFVRAALDQGWDATGIEQSDSAIARAKEFYHVELSKEFAGQRYDVATLWDVVEHLRDPQETLMIIARHLVEGGLLFIETGNYESWLRTAKKDKWGLYLFDHQFYFTPSSLDQVVHGAGYDDLCLLNVPRSHPSVHPLRLVRHPMGSVLSWIDWVRAKARWPAHGDMDVLVAVARKRSAASAREENP